MAGNRILVDLFSGTVKMDIAEIPDMLLEGAGEGILELAELFKGLWQVHIRVDTGSARDSIRVERGGTGKNWKQVRVRGGGYITNPKTGRLVDYMAIIEKKYGAGKQAWSEVRPQSDEIIRRLCLAEVAKLPGVKIG